MALWKKIDGWSYEYFELDTPAIEFDKFEPIVDMWNSNRNGTDIPSWSTFDFYDFVGWHGKICKNTYLSNPFDYRIDLFGTDFVDLVGREMTGMMGSDLVNTGEEDDIDFEFYKWVYENACISRVRGNIPIEGREHRLADILDLPLSNNGISVTHSIEVLLPI